MVLPMGGKDPLRPELCSEMLHRSALVPVIPLQAGGNGRDRTCHACYEDNMRIMR